MKREGRTATIDARFMVPMHAPKRKEALLDPPHSFRPRSGLLRLFDNLEPQRVGQREDRLF